MQQTFGKENPEVSERRYSEVSEPEKSPEIRQSKSQATIPQIIRRKSEFGSTRDIKTQLQSDEQYLLTDDSQMLDNDNKSIPLFNNFIFTYLYAILYGTKSNKNQS